MKLKVNVISGKINKVFINDEEVKYFSSIVEKYAEEKGFVIENSRLLKKGHNISIFLKNYNSVYKDIIEDSFRDYEYNIFVDILNTLIEEVKKAIENFNKNFTVELDLDNLKNLKEN